MGQSFEVTCYACRERYTINEGIGERLHMLRCIDCQAEKAVSFEEMGEIRLRYLIGLPEPFGISNPGMMDTGLNPLSEGDYEREVERIAGSCRCGGTFRLDAEPRCPRCFSAEYTADPINQMQTKVD